ncbi:MAG: hypothetical protein ACFFDN_06850 [Candidatus Hodarchaeota archaeon]
MFFQEQFIFFMRVLCVEFLVFGMLYVSYMVARKILGRSTVALRWCATIVIGMWLSTLVFNLLITLGQFNLKMAVLSIGVIILIIRIIGAPLNVFLGYIIQDLAWLKRTCWLIKKSPYRWFFYIFFVFAILTCLRTAILPLLGWDSLTYHGVKAGMWVQSSKHTLMMAPGGWGRYRTFFAGGEIFTAWAMLPFHSDLLASVVDAIEWLFLGLALYALSRELGIRSRFRLIAVAYILFIPALWLSIGSGYVEPSLNLALMLGLLFSIRFMQYQSGCFLLLCSMAFGVAGGIKITALPILALVWLTFFIVFLFNRSDLIILRRWILLSILAIILALGPWFMRNLQETGYPLDMPVKIAGLKLGQTSKVIKWYQDRPGLPSYNLRAEINALSKMFRLPTKVSPHLSIISLLPLIISLIILFRMTHSNKKIPILMIGLIFAVLISFYYPGFSVVRIIWAPVTGRFLLPIICPAVIISFSWCKSHSKKSDLYALFLSFITLIHVLTLAFYGWAPFEIIAIFLMILVLFILTIVIKYLTIKYSTKSIVVGVAILSPLLLLPPLNIFRNQTRYHAALQSTVLHPIKKYWVNAARLIDTPNISHRIAVTSGPHQNADNWFMYFFMGKKLQNRLYYIPITENGNIIDFGLDGERERNGVFSKWLSRLYKKEITYVMSFSPKSLELSWMEDKSELFKRLVGDGKSWGLYEVITITNYKL